jgi:hypothetical protein
VRGTRRKSRYAVVGAAIALGFGSATPAQATNFSYASGASGCGGVNMTDNADVYVWYESLAADTSLALSNTRTTDYNPLDTNTYNEDILTTQTDVVAYDYDYESTICGQTWISSPGGSGILGYSRCMIVVAANNKCDQNRLDFDNDFMGPQSAANEQSLACHEFGHAMGLAHISPTVTDSCMLSPFAGQVHPSGHDDAHINANY